MPVIARSPEGKVISVWGTALIRGADGKLRLLKVGDVVRQGDQILTTQEGIVQIANGDVAAPVQAADAKAPADNEVDRVIAELNAGDRLAAPAAGLSGGGDGSLEAGLRVDRISEGVGGFQIPSGTGDETVSRVDAAGGTTTPEDRGGRTPGPAAPSSAISAAEEGAPTNLGLTAPAGNGTIRVDQVPAIGEIRKADGTLVTAGTVLTPADLPGLVYVPPSEYDGSVPAGNFGYTLTVNGQTVTGGTVINLSPVNDAPVATPAAASGNEDGTLPLSLGGTDVDGSIVGVTVTRLPAGGTLFLADGVTPVTVGQTLTPAQAATLLYRPGADFNGDQTILFTVTDNGGATSAPAAVSLTIVAVNDAPVPTIGSGGSGNEDTPIAVSLGGTDVDGTVTTVTITRLPGNGTLFLADGVTPVAASTTLTPAQAASLVFVPAANFNGNVTVGFSVTDNEGAVSPPFNAVVTVAPVNDGPVAQADSATLAEDSVATGNVLGNDSDIDGPSLAVSSFVFGGTTHPAGSTAIVGGVGTLTMTADGRWTFTPAPNFNGAVPAIQVTVSDGSLSSTSTLALTVTPVNDAPAASSTVITVAEESADTPLGLAAPTDVDGNALTITVTGLPTVGTITLADGTPVTNGQVLTAAQLAGLQFDAPADLLASTSTRFTYTVSDGTVTVNAGTTINVTPVNDAPVASSSTITVAEESADTPLGLAAPTDVDGNALTITITGLPSVGTITLANGTPVTNGQVLTAAQLAGLQFDAPADLLASTSTSFTYSVSDGTVTVNAGTTISVTPVNDAPVASSSTITVAEESANTPLGLTAPTDVDGNALTITVTGLPSVGTITLADGTPVTNGQVLTTAQLAGLQFDAPADLLASTSTSFTYSVSDGTVTVAAGTTISVTPINDAPVASSSTITVAEESANTPLGLTAPTDVDGNALTITVTGLPTVGTITLANGTPVTNGQVLTAAQLAGLQFDAPADLLASTSTSFTYTVSDGTVTVNAGTTISVTPINDAPVAIGDSASTTEDTALTIAAATLLANDSDVDGDTLSIVSVQGAVNGTVALVGGDVVFTPAAGYNGPASFSYTVSDGRGGSSIATVNLTVNPDNDAPVAVADIVGAINEDTALTITPATLLGNDSDPDGDSLSIASVQGAVNGTVALVGGNVVFTPNANYNGPASFSYTISDGNGGSSTATVNLTVNPVNDAPVANPDFFTTAEDTPIIIPRSSLLANDTDVDGDTLLVVAAGGVNQGTLSFVGGNLVFTPAANYSGPASFFYTITDGNGAVASGTVNINVTPVNDVPVASSSSITVAEESANTPLGLTVPTDADGDSLTITVTGLPSIGTVTLADGTPISNGQVLTAAQLAGLQFDAPADLLAATSTSFSYSVSDGTSTVNASTTINVNPVNDAPVANPDFLTTAEDTPITISLPSLLANDTDVDGDTLLVVAAGNVNQGTLSFVGGNLVFTPAANYSGPASFLYTITDGNGAISSATVTINVTPVNDVPVASSSTISVAEESANTPLGLSAPTDVDGNPLTITVTGLPSVGTITLADGTPVTNGQVLTAAQLAGLQFDAPADLLASTSTSFTYSVSDGTATVNAGTTINVTPVNDAPVAAADLASTAINTTLASIPVLANDDDVDGDTLTVTAATLANPALGTVSINPDGTLAFTPATNISGAVLINYTISDGNGGSSSATLTVNVGANTPPQGADLTVSVAEDGSRSFSAADFGFSDADAGQTLAAVRIDALPTAGSLLLNGNPVAAGTIVSAVQLAAGALVFVPAADANGSAYASFGFSVQDNAGAFDTTSNTITIDVSPVNDAPLASSSTITVAEESANTPLGLSAPTDVDGNALTITVTGLPSVGTITLANGTPVTNGQVLTAAQLAGLQFDAPADLLASTSTSFTYSVSDGTVTVNAGTTINVTPVNDAPVASSSTITVAEESTNTPLGLTAPTDIDGNALTITVTGLPNVGTITLADGTPVTNGQALTAAQLAGLQFDAPADLLASTTSSFTYSVSDGTVTVNAGTTISVTPVNDAPVASSSTITVAEESANTPLGLTAPTDIDGNALTVTITGLPTVGAITLADGTPVTNGQVLTAAQLAGLQFDAPADLLASTSTSFTYSVSDSAVTVNAGTTISVTPINDAPVASSSTITVAEESANTPLGLTAPTDIDGNSLTITVTGLPSVGTITLADGTPVSNGQVLTAAQLAGLQFDAPADLLASTSTSFTYSVSDGTVTVNAGTTISITPVNDAPVASSSTITVAEESANTPLGLTAPTDVDGNPLTITVTGLPAVGAITLADGTPVTNGQVLTAAQLAGLQFDAPADLLASISTSFTYSVSDGTVTVNAGTTISVTPVNDAPVASSSTITVAEESANTPLGLTAPSDVDGNALAITVTGLPSVGTITLADGTLVTNGQVLTAAQLAGLQFDAPADLIASTSTSFTYNVSDGNATVNAGTTINVTPVNDAPVASSSTITVAEESTNTPLGLTVPTDIDGNALTITITGLPSVGTIILANGTPVTNGQTLTAAQLAGLQFDAPADLLASTSTSFSYTVSDGTVTVNAGTTISVTPVNDAPVVSSSTITVAEESANAPLGLVAPTDADGNALTITVTGLPAVGTITLADGTPITNGQVLTAAQLAGLQFDAPADLLASTSTSFSYTVSDGTVTVNAGTTINVTPVNDVPVASSSTITVAEESTNTPLGLTAPTDVDGNALTITVTGLPAVGTITLADGTPVSNGQVLTAAQLAGLQFDAPADLLASASTSFTYSVSDGTVTVNAGTTISVTPVNDAPVASNSTITVAEESVNTPLGLTAPTDIDGNALTITVTGLPSVGTITLANGTPITNGQVLTAAQLAGLQFDAPADLLASTSTSFTYSVSDGTVTVNAGTTISVTPVNDAPVASSSTITVAEESANTPLGLTAPTDVDGNALTITVTGLPSVGTITLANGTPVTNGQVLTAAQLAGLQFDAPADLLASTSTSFTYSVSDGTVTVNASSTINVTPVNDAPGASSSTITVAEESANTPLGLTAPTDVDGNALTITVTGLPSVGTITLANGTPVTSGQVLTAAQLAGLQFDAPADLLASTSTSFTYTVSDGTVTVNAGTTISVTPVNDAPVASSTAITVAEESANTPLGLTAPTDVDGNALTITVTGLPSVGTITLASGTPVTNGQVLTAAQLAGLQFDAPADLLASTSTSFTYSVSDGAVAVNAGTTISVTPVNDAPVASSSAITVAEESANTPLGLTAPTDVDGNPLTITVTGLPTVGTITLANGTPVTNGQVLTAAQLAGLQFDAPADLLTSISTSFTYSVSDGTVTVNAGTTIGVTPVNDAPVASSSAITVAEESVNTPLGLTAPTDVDGNALTIAVTGLPAVGTITLADGTPVTNGQVLTAAQLASLQFDAPADLLASTSTSFTYSVSDGTVTVNAGTTINVTPVNDAPVASNSMITVAEESANTPLGLTAPTDVDGNALTITVTGLPGVGTITLANGTPVTNGQVLTAAQLAGLQFDAPADLLASTSTSFNYTVSDGTVTVNAGTTINVTPVNDAPVASSTAITVAEESANTPLGLTAPTDVDGNALTITVTGLPTVGTITLANGTPVANGQVLTAAQLAGLQFDAPADLLASTSTSFTYSVSDGAVTVNAGTTISVTPVNDSPVASSSTITVAEESANTPLGLTAPTDVDGNALTITVTGLPTVGTVTLADGTPVANGQVLTAAQLAGLQFDAPADLLASTSTSFTYSVSDGTVTVNAGTTISVTPVNDAPVASSSTITVAEESANTPLGLTAPTDVDGNALTITVTGLPTVGTITLANGTPVTNGQVLTAAQLAGLQFDAPADLLASTGTSFTYSVSDGTVTVNAGTTISVTPVNDAPVASSSTITVAEESANTPLGLAAPTDVDGNALTITVTGLPTVGTITLANGTPVTNGQTLTAAQLAGLQFDAPADLPASTSTSFTYSVSDGTATVNAGTTISVTPINDAPIAQSAAFSVAEDAAVVNGALVATDADAGAVLSFALNGAAPAGLVVNANGTYSFNPANAAYQSLAVGQSQVINVPYTVTDNAGATSTANLVITVTGTNDAPVAQAAAFSVAEDAAIVNGTVTATDIDTGATRTFALNGAAPAGLTFNSSGSYSFNPANAAYQSLGVGQSTVITVPYTVTDDRGATSTANLVITVTGTNDAPVAVADSGTLAENATLTATAATGVLANDTDVDNGDSRSVSAISFGATGGTVGTGLNGTYGTLTLNANGSYSYVANRPAAEALLAGQVVTESFTYTVRDTAGATSQATITFTITGAADAPTITGPLAGTVQEDTTLSTGGTLVITDPDAGQSSFVAQSGTPGTYGSFSISAGGVWSYTLNNAAANVQALPAGSAPTESFVVTSADGTQRTITVTVNGLNDAPVAQPRSFTVAEDAAVVTGAVTATDVDTGATLSFALNGAAPAGLTFNSNGSYSFNPANAAYQSLGVGQQQVITVPYTVTDNNGATSTANLTITVTGTNDAPVANANTGPGTEDTVLTIVPATLLGNDVDIDSGDTLTITSVQGAVNGTVALSGGNIVFTPTANYSGPATFTYTVSDGRGGTSTATVTVNIAAVADAPTLVINGSSSTGGTTTPPSFPASTGLVRDFFQDIGSVSAANAGNIATVETAVEAATRTSTSVVTDISIPDLNVDDAYRYTGFIYLTAGQTYEVAGSRDDTLAVKLGGNSVYGVGYNNWGAFTATGFTPSVSGYYSLEVIAYNGDGVGDLDINMSVNGGAAVDLNTSNFRIYTNASDFSSSPTVAGPMVPNGDGGYYPGGAGGSEDTAIRLGSISASLNDADGSETLSLRIGSIPVGAVISDGTNSFTATAGNTSVGVTGWSLNNLTITPPLHYAGTINLSVTATATESTGPTATTTGTLPVLVTAVADAPVVAGDTIIVTVAQEDTAATVNFPILATRVDVDGSETLRVLVSGVPTGYTFSTGTNNGGGVWQFTAAQLDGLTLTLPANHATTGTTLTVTAVTREASTGAEASDSSTITLIADSADGTSYTGTGTANTINGNTGDNFVNALGGNDTVTSGNGEDLVRGGDGNDSIDGGAANDALWGDAGNDIILGGTGSDLIRGGAGNDTLTGGATAGAADGTADVFAWSLADAGAAGAPAVDTITDFNVGAVSAGGDVLDLRDLLSGDVLGAGNSAGNLANFLDFAVSGSGASASTTIRISSTGQYADGVYSAGATDQTIVLQGVDLPTSLGLGSGATDAQIVQELLTRGKLIVDSVG